MTRATELELTKSSMKMKHAHLKTLNMSSRFIRFDLQLLKRIF